MRVENGPLVTVLHIVNVKSYGTIIFLCCRTIAEKFELLWLQGVFLFLTWRLHNKRIAHHPVGHRPGGTLWGHLGFVLTNIR